MPGGDKTGPDGGGPKTGFGRGYCADNDQPGYLSGRRERGLGRGFGNGRGRGWRNRSNAVEDQSLGGALQQILDKLNKLGR